MKAIDKAVDKSDTEYIKSILIMDNLDEINDCTNKEKLSLILVDFLSTPLRLQAIKFLGYLIKEKRFSGNLVDLLERRKADFESLVKLKAKIDYLKSKRQ